MKIKFLIILLLIVLVSTSCDDNFNPFGEYKEKYILTCLLDGNSSSQVATLSKSYFTGTFNPYDNTTDPALEGAEIRVWLSDSVYLFKDSTIQRQDTSHYNTPYKFYYTDKVKPTAGKVLEIEALLPSGKRLRSSTVTPNDISFTNQNPNVIPPVDNNFLTFRWQSQSTYTFYDIRILVTYYKSENGFNVKYEKEIPIAYNTQDGMDQPVYPLAARQTVVSYPMDVVTKFMESISEGDNNKSNYYVEIKPKVEVLVMDEALSRYYSSTSQSLNDLTVRLDENDYTNIDGGFGIFGTYISKRYTAISFIASYLQSFGYQVIYNE
jgi:hypothetical protein